MDDKQNAHTVVRRPADPRPLERQDLHIRLADSHRLEGLLLKKAHNALRPADHSVSVGWILPYRTPPTSSTAPLHIVYPTAAGIAPLVQSALYGCRAD